MKLTFSFARFAKWYPEEAQDVQEYLRSRQDLYRDFITNGRDAILRSYTEPEGRRILNDFEDTLSENGCSIPFDVEVLMSEAEDSLRDGVELRFRAFLLDLEGVLLLLVIGVISAAGLGYVLWREAHARSLELRYLVRLRIEVEHGGVLRPGRINDISQRGARLFFVGGHDLAPGLPIRILWQDKPFDGRVQWVGHNVAGVEFRPVLAREQLVKMRTASSGASRVRRRRFPANAAKTGAAGR